MRTTLLFCAAALMVVCVPARAADQEMLASAKSLYESASYEAALSEFSAIHTSELADTVDTYKALCLLGLGRTRDAEQALELVVTRRPMLVLNDAEYSPRVVALFRDVRKKALPAAAQQLYTGRENGLREQEVRRGRRGVQAGAAGHRGDWRRRRRRRRSPI